MKTIGSILRLEFLPSSTDLGLLVLRLWLGTSLLVLHGWTKLSTFQEMSGKFPDPLGLGSKASLSLAVFGEVAGAIFIILGLFARFGALSCAITMSVAFFITHGAKLKGSGSGELAFIYLAGFITILFAGAGRYSIDGGSKSGKAPKSSSSSKS
jgi:putative oxidoreductase